MKAIIAGSRTFNDYDFMARELVDVTDEVTEVVSGGDSGVGVMGERWARVHDLPVRVFEARRDERGVMWALRNIEMAEYADMAFVFADGRSADGEHLIDQMEKLGKRCLVIGV